MDIFTSKDIQEEKKQITRIFQKEALNCIDDREEIENENIAKFLINMANVSRKAYNNSNELFINIFKEFSSSWVKEDEKEPEGKKKYENYFNLFKGKGRFQNFTIFIFKW